MLRIDAEQMWFQDAKEPDQTFDGLCRLLTVRQRLYEGHKHGIRRLRYVSPGA